MLAPFSAPSRGIAILILPGGPLGFQIGMVAGVIAYAPWARFSDRSRDWRDRSRDRRHRLRSQSSMKSLLTIRRGSTLAAACASGHWPLPLGHDGDRSRSVIDHRRNRLRGPRQRLRHQSSTDLSPRQRLVIDHRIGVIAHGPGVIDHAVSPQ